MIVDDEYAKIAPFYERMLSRFLYPIRKNIRTFLHHHDHIRILDVCCGTGGQLHMLVKTDLDLIGIDLSEAMLKEAQHRCPDNVQFYRYDATEMDFSEQSFDAVLLTFALHEKNSLDREIILKKSFELVRPGGHLIVGDYCQLPNTVPGYLLGKALIPCIERAAGIDHYHYYRDWMESGALEGMLGCLAEAAEVISTHFSGSVMICSVEKKSDLHKVLHAIHLPNTQ